LASSNLETFIGDVTRGQVVKDEVFDNAWPPISSVGPNHLATSAIVGLLALVGSSTEFCFASIMDSLCN
jgi:hypothetical protein